MASRTFNFIEICAGGGMCGIGASAALQYLGRAARCVCHIERNGYAAATLVGRMEDAALDQATVWDCLESFDCKPWRGLVDLAIATIPCQGNSVAGKRLLEDDERNLWPATRATLRDLECEYFFLENVSGMLIPDGSGLAPIGVVLGDLAASGYDAEWNCISAEGFGAPHKRERIFILAHRDKAEYLRTDEPIRPNPDSDFWMDLKKEQEWGRGFDKLVAMGIAERRGSYSENLRMVDGIPDAMDRIGGCGNAVIPQVAEWIGKRIMEVAKP